MNQKCFKVSPVIIWTCLFVIFCFSACSDEEIDIETIDRYKFDAPSNFPLVTYTFDNNPITEAGFKLGKELLEMDLYHAIIAIYKVPPLLIRQCIH